MKGDTSLNKSALKEVFEREGYTETFPKKDARVLYKAKHGVIEDLIVEFFENPDDHQELYNHYSHDFGNCLSNWDKWTLSDALLKIFVSYQVPAKIRKKIIFELSKVKEWRSDLAQWIYSNWGE